jgi:membrane-associated phospholipid phosphatase
MVVLMAVVPLYLFIPQWWPPATRHLPELALDRAVPLVPAWALAYGALYLALIVLPALLVREEELQRRTVRAYLFIWLTAYLFFFVIYPTEAPRPERVVGDGFAVWGLATLYGADPPRNCFPSLHVAHSFVSALACRRVHPKIGRLALVSAALVAASTLFTKQHYVVDVIGGVALALAAATLFLRGYPPERTPDEDRLAAPALTLAVGAVCLTGLLGFWLLYLGSGQTHFDFGP